jgi:hypothetical protein
MERGVEDKLVKWCQEVITDSVILNVSTKSREGLSVVTNKRYHYILGIMAYSTFHKGRRSHMKHR